MERTEEIESLFYQAGSNRPDPLPKERCLADLKRGGLRRICVELGPELVHDNRERVKTTGTGDFVAAEDALDQKPTSISSRSPAAARR